MDNPVHAIVAKQQPFIYFHTRAITRSILDSAIAASKSLEIDLSVSDDGLAFIGHSLKFYKFNRLSPPENLPLDVVLAAIKDTELYLVIDCKDSGALPRAHEIIKQLGPDRCLFHAWSDALLFKPYPEEITVQPHWEYEEIPFQEILDLKSVTNVPVLISTRGLTKTRLADHGDEIIQKITKTAQDKIEAVNLNLANSKIAPKAFLERLTSHNILPFINVDRTPVVERPATFLGMSDKLNWATDPKQFG